MKNKKFYFDNCNFYQFLSICLWIEDEMQLVSDDTETLEIVLREHLSFTETRIQVLNREQIFFYVQYEQIELSKMQFVKLCRVAEKMLNQLVKVDCFDCREFQPKYLALWLSKILPALSKEKIDYVYLDELLVSEDAGKVKLKESEKFQALKGEIDIDQRKQKYSNGIGQTNSSRLKDNFLEVKERGYPFNDEYIILYNADLVIKDGAHRATSLYYLYGNIKIPVKRLYFNWEVLFGRGFVFPFERVRKPENMKGAVRIVLYGAGKVGKIFARQIGQTEGSVQMILWVDRAYEKLDLKGVEAPNKICQTEYDYVVIALENKETAEKVKINLKAMGVEEKKMIWQKYYRE